MHGFGAHHSGGQYDASLLGLELTNGATLLLISHDAANHRHMVIAVPQLFRELPDGAVVLAINYGLVRSRLLEESKQFVNFLL